MRSTFKTEINGPIEKVAQLLADHTNNKKREYTLTSRKLKP
jgi:hypothetical protein